MKPPKTVQLPSKRVIALAGRATTSTVKPRTRDAGEPLFADAIALVESGDLELREAGRVVPLSDLALGDFHALRAIATKLGWLVEEEITISCKNCGESFALSPCARLELGPFVDRELDDEELDRTLDLDRAHRVEGLGDVRLEAVTVSSAMPLFRALARRRLVVTPRVVRALGVVSIDGVTDPAKLARTLARCTDRAWSGLTDLFLRAHYPPRLFAVAMCGACGARNDVDAPFEREFEPSAHADAPPLDRGESEKRGTSNDEPFVDFERFDERAREIARAIWSDVHTDVVLVVEGGVPAVDDGGEPLLGAYVPPYAGDMTTPSRAPEVTLYYRTFRAMWNEDGAFDWEDEVRETLEHELEHHGYHLAGRDPMDEEERRAIDDEAAKVVGRRALARESVGALGGDFVGFLRRTWPIWVLLLAATVLATLAER